MFWGAGGVKRDMETAVKYYAMTVKEAPMNPVGLYDYGIVLLRVRLTACIESTMNLKEGFDYCGIIFVFDVFIHRVRLFTGSSRFKERANMNYIIEFLL